VSYSFKRDCIYLISAELASIPIEWFLYNASKDQILDPDYRRSFVATFFSTRPNLQSCIWLTRHFEHALNPDDSTNAHGVLSLLATLLSEARSHVTDSDMVELKEILFMHPSGFKQLAMSPEVDDQVYIGLREVIQSSFDPSSSTDSRILSDISTYWAALLQNRFNRDKCNVRSTR
jgi:nucleolar pre-ribosomal-associated protein 1